MNKQVTILTFSSRESGNCAAIADFIHGYFSAQNQTSVQVFKIDNAAFPACGGCDYECLRPGVSCPSITDEQRTIMDFVCKSDLVYFVVPNYCGFPCANYFAFNERTVGYFNMDNDLMKKYLSVPKRFVLVSNSKNDQFTEAMRHQTNEAPMILYMATGKYGKRSIAGDLMSSDAARAELKAFLDA